MELSYWEYKSWLTNIDHTIIGSGIVGLSTAIELRKRFPQSNILVVEKGILPEGASTKNAGFACFGSISELMMDLKNHSEEELFDLVRRRWEGLQLLRATLGDENIGFKSFGGHEVFLESEGEAFNDCRERIPYFNQLLKPLFKKDVFKQNGNLFGFRTPFNYITNDFEGQLDTGKMMQSLLNKAGQLGIRILNGIDVIGFEQQDGMVAVATENFDFKTHNLYLATNGFANKILDLDVEPARAQVLITEPIKDLSIKGTFHLDRGYFYFRNIDNRILLGGGRNLDLENERTMEFGTSPKIQRHLERILNEVIFPNRQVRIDRRWSGIMGVGPQKKPLVQALSNNVFCGLRLGGMGVALGYGIGQKMAGLI